MQAHTLCEVGILGIVLLRIYSGTVLRIFIEIGSYLTDKEQKISWHRFLRHGVHVDIRKRFSENCRHKVVEIDEFAVSRKFRKSGRHCYTLPQKSVLDFCQ